MNVYKNDRADIVYPFLTSVPFPMGWVQDIKLALKKVSNQVFITTIGSTGNGFYIQLQTPQVYIGYFQTQQSWLSIDNQEAFGFVKFGQASGLKKRFSGKWELPKKCYTLPTALSGITKVSVNGVQLAQPQTNILGLSIAGDLSQRESTQPFVINIGRDSDPHSDYNAVDNYTEAQNGILSVNGASIKTLNIVSADQSWLKVGQSIQVKKGSGNYVLYLQSKKDFQSCDMSDSQVYYPTNQ